jgi:hypothetical protein
LAPAELRLDIRGNYHLRRLPLELANLKVLREFHVTADRYYAYTGCIMYVQAVSYICRLYNICRGKILIQDRQVDEKRT